MVRVTSPAAAAALPLPPEALSCLLCGEPLELAQPRPSRPELILGICTRDECGAIWTLGDHAPAADQAGTPDVSPPDWRIEGRFLAQPLRVA